MEMAKVFNRILKHNRLVNNLLCACSDEDDLCRLVFCCNPAFKTKGSRQQAG